VPAEAVRRIETAEIKLTEREIEAAVAVLRSGALRQGKECDLFEEEFARKVGAKYAVTAANGSATLHLAYMAFLEPGEEVLVPSFTFIATGSMVRAAGGRPVFCDVDPKTFLMDLDDAETKLTERTRAISPVHLFGNCCDIEPFTSFARKHNLKIVWDAAQAHGAAYKGTDVGAFPDFVSYSFYPSKNMFVGEGGITLTNDEEMAYRMRFMRSHGQTGKYFHTMHGLNYRMTDVEGAIGRAQLARLDDMLSVRRRNFDILYHGLAAIDGIHPQTPTPDTAHAVHQFCITLDANRLGMSRDELAEGLKARGVATGVHYPRGLHQQPVFVEEYGPMRLPVTERLAETILALPVHHGMSKDDARYVVRAVQDAVRKPALVPVSA
jgi:perosamine synthetase